MTPIEIIAVIFAILILVKIIVVFIRPKAWIRFAETITRNHLIITLVYIILAIILGYYVFSVFSVVTVFVIAIFGILLMAIGLIPYFESIIKTTKKMTREKILQSFWLSLLIWLIFAIWVLYVVFS